ncbi:hypothetical protein GEMRC1_004580 [Eukaryota sp. GEM-RC1]
MQSLNAFLKTPLREGCLSFWLYGPRSTKSTSVNSALLKNQSLFRAHIVSASSYSSWSALKSALTSSIKQLVQGQTYNRICLTLDDVDAVISYPQCIQRPSLDFHSWLGLSFEDSLLILFISRKHPSSFAHCFRNFSEPPSLFLSPFSPELFSSILSDNTLLSSLSQVEQELWICFGTALGSHATSINLPISDCLDLMRNSFNKLLELHQSSQLPIPDCVSSFIPTILAQPRTSEVQLIEIESIVHSLSRFAYYSLLGIYLDMSNEKGTCTYFAHNNNKRSRNRKHNLDNIESRKTVFVRSISHLPEAFAWFSLLAKVELEPYSQSLMRLLFQSTLTELVDFGFIYFSSQGAVRWSSRAAGIIVPCVKLVACRLGIEIAGFMHKK